MNVQNQDAPRLDDPAEMAERFAALVATADHAESAEEAHRMIDAAIGQSIELNEIGFDHRQLESFGLRLRADDFEHRLREVDRQAAQAALQKWQQRPSGPAAEIGDELTGLEIAFGDRLVEIEKRM